MTIRNRFFEDSDYIDHNITIKSGNDCYDSIIKWRPTILTILLLVLSISVVISLLDPKLSYYLIFVIFGCMALIWILANLFPIHQNNRFYDEF